MSPEGLTVGQRVRIHVYIFRLKEIRVNTVTIAEISEQDQQIRFAEFPGFYSFQKLGLIPFAGDLWHKYNWVERV